jgi:iron complex outermembrane receptor protein
MSSHSAFPHHHRLAAALIAAFCAMPRPAFCDAPPPRPADLGELSLEELGNLQVTSVSRKAQRFNDTAAALFVITNEDIRRSGVTSIPEALRMVPGIQVGRIGNDRWAVSARGFAGSFSNKLLVQIDGRSIYSQLFSGVLWEAQDVVLDDIERIEVIRGPGAALWGANAVNGIINIITRSAADTQGGLVQVGAGNQEKGFATLRYGGRAGEDTQYRVYARGYARDEAVDMNGAGAGDDSRSQHAGFRLDRRIDAGNRLMLSGDSREAHLRVPYLAASLLPPYSSALLNAEKNRGINLLARYEHTLQDGSAATLQAYVDSTIITTPFFTEHRDTYDLDFQHRVLLGSRHDFIWGLNYRLSRDRITTPEAYLQISPPREDFQIASAFVHDEIALLPERLRLIAGVRLEHNSYTGLEPQPNLRLLWTPDPTHTVWAAWSRAVRTPSRAERGSTLDIEVFPPFSADNPTPLPALLRTNSVGVQPPSEKLTAFELGYRAQFGPRFALDLTAFANRYTQIGSSTEAPPQLVLDPVPHLLVLAQSDSGLSARTRGLEASLDWRALERWRLQASYTLLHMDLPTTSADDLRNAIAQAIMGQAPANQLSLRSQFDLAPGHQLDLWLRHVARLAYGDVPAYTTLDARYGWRPTKNLDLSLVGQNLLERRHPEVLSDTFAAPLLQVQRGVFLRATWKY